MSSYSLCYQKGKVSLGLLLVVLLAGGLEWLLNRGDSNTSIDRFESWRLPVIVLDQAASDIIRSLQENGKWPGIDELPNIDDSDGVVGSTGSIVTSLGIYTLLAVIQTEQQQPAIILKSEQGEVSRLQVGDTIGDAYRLEEVLGEQATLSFIGESPVNTADSKVILKLYPNIEN